MFTRLCNSLALVECTSLAMLILSLVCREVEDTNPEPPKPIAARPKRGNARTNVRIQNMTDHDITVSIKKCREPWHNSFCSEAHTRIVSGAYEDWQRYKTCEVTVQADGVEDMKFEAKAGFVWWIAGDGVRFEKGHAKFMR